MIRSIYYCNFMQIGKVVLEELSYTHTHGNWGYAALIVRDAQYQTCLRQVLINRF